MTPDPAAAPASVRDRTDLDPDDVVALLLAQHDRVADLLETVGAAHGRARRTAFDELRAFLAVHETAEEMVLRPVTELAGGRAVAAARNAEEKESNVVLAQLQHLDLDSVDFERRLAGFGEMVRAHAAAEERDELPIVLAHHDPQERRRLGQRLRAAEAIAPTRPHPSAAGSPVAQWAVGPVASIIDRTRDAIRKVAG